MNKAIKQIYVFLGLPASGKGTQASLFATRRGLKVVGIGDLIRKKLSFTDKDDPFIAEIRHRYEQGIPQPDDVIFDLVRAVLDDSEGGIVFDNFPFSVSQVRLLEQYIVGNNLPEPIIIFLKVDPDTVIDRIVKRRVCSECGAVYVGSEASICEKCGGSLVARSDDNEDTVKTRIGQYLPRINEVIKIYKESGRVLEINGEPKVEIVENMIEHAMAGAR